MPREFELLSYRERVIEEKRQLDVKIAALAAFGTTSLHKDLPEEEKDLLLLQFHTMQNYSIILKRRIASWDQPSLKNRLARIAGIIEHVDNRCMAYDGAVPPTLDEMTQAEISSIYELAKGKTVA